MNMVGHDHVSVQLIVTDGAIVQQRVDEKLGYACDLKHRAAIACRQGDERNARPVWAHGLRHKNLNGKEATRARVSHEWGVGLLAGCAKSAKERRSAAWLDQPHMR